MVDIHAAPIVVQHAKQPMCSALKRVRMMTALVKRQIALPITGLLAHAWSMTQTAILASTLVPVPESSREGRVQHGNYRNVGIWITLLKTMGRSKLSTSMVFNGSTETMSIVSGFRQSQGDFGEMDQLLFCGLG